MSQSILIQYLVWQFLDVPKELAKAWKNYLRFFLHFFSLPTLIKTLFSPWHGITWSYGRGFSFKRYAEVIISNGFSRVIGLCLRLFLICIGLVIEIIIFIIGFLIFFCWLFLPAILVLAIIYGINLLF
ncbi:hypothetical protein KKC63_01170 [Patescibacteria group bacterium]|nr:hypothetical protein [Patescibacteria group bacterium]MBU4023081.1 hypothetical protein [Patescibacteria group bacterium]